MPWLLRSLWTDAVLHNGTNQDNHMFVVSQIRKPSLSVSPGPIPAISVRSVGEARPANKNGYLSGGRGTDRPGKCKQHSRSRAGPSWDPRRFRGEVGIPTRRRWEQYYSVRTAI